MGCRNCAKSKTKTAIGHKKTSMAGMASYTQYSGSPVPITKRSSTTPIKNAPSGKGRRGH